MFRDVAVEELLERLCRASGLRVIGQRDFPRPDLLGVPALILIGVLVGRCAFQRHACQQALRPRLAEVHTHYAEKGQGLAGACLSEETAKQVICRPFVAGELDVPEQLARHGAISLGRKIPRQDGSVQHVVAIPANRNQVGLCVVTKGALPSPVVDIKIPGASTDLAAPAVTLQDFSAQPGIAPGRHSNSRAFRRPGIIHVAGCS